jgi:hypothetical protein
VEGEVLEDGEQMRYPHRAEEEADRVELSFSRTEQDQYSLPQSLRSELEKLERLVHQETAVEEVQVRPFTWVEIL